MILMAPIMNKDDDDDDNNGSGGGKNGIEGGVKAKDVQNPRFFRK